MSPFMKGVLGFVGCAGICGAAYAIGKHAGREETLKEVELEECRMAAKKLQTSTIVTQQPENTVVTPVAQNEPEEKVEPVVTAAENVRKKHGIKNKLFGSVGVIKDLLGGNTEDKQLTMTVEDGDLVARISQKQGG
jgi:hypothetical protein